jgi:hypothetical protein
MVCQSLSRKQLLSGQAKRREDCELRIGELRTLPIALAIPPPRPRKRILAQQGDQIEIRNPQFAFKTVLRRLQGFLEYWQTRAGVRIRQTAVPGQVLVVL